MSDRLVLQDAIVARDNITRKQQKEIAELYKEWANELDEKAEFYRNKTTSSSWVSEMQVKELQKQLRATSKQVSNEIYKKIKENIYLVSDAVVKNNAKWLAKFGFSAKGVNAAFSSVPDSTVRRLITGQIYKSGWSLSGRIWSDNEKTIKDAYRIVAKGIAQNQSIYDIAKELERYVTPGTKKQWNPKIAMRNTRTGEIEYKRIYKRNVDYNAQRLARTLIQHGYQQSLEAVTAKNPFVIKYVWWANGSRSCPLCKDRDGNEYSKGEVPLDHPNGMCIIEPIIADDMADRLADWVNSPSGTYPDIDDFAADF